MIRQLTLAVRVRIILSSIVLLFISLPTIAQAQSSGDFVPVTDAMLQDPAAGDWLMWRRTLDSWGFSPLDQVNRDNVDQLRMVWTRDLATGTGEITPLPGELKAIGCLCKKTLIPKFKGFSFLGT